MTLQGVMLAGNLDPKLDSHSVIQAILVLVTILLPQLSKG